MSRQRGGCISKSMGASRLAVLAASAIACLSLVQGSALAGTLTEEQQRRVIALEKKLLAPCCYQEPVGRHQSDAALRMRMEIARFVEEGKTEAQIIEGYVQLYGQRIVADYAATPAWAQYVPWFLSVAGAGLLAWWIRRTVRQPSAPEGQAG